MKLLFENWRRYLNEENVPTLSMPTQRLLQLLVNLKKFGGLEQFLSRTKLVINRGGEIVDGSIVQFFILIDGEVAGTVTYDVLGSDEDCRPPPFGDKKTFMLISIARTGKFKGYGIGRLVSFLSACYINDIGGVVTSDRDTSDKAGKQLVDSLKMMGAKESNQFDYVGYFIEELKFRFFASLTHPEGKFDSERTFNITPQSPKSDVPLIGGIADKIEKSKFDKEFEELVKKVIDHLSPITQSEEDDCSPSVNLAIGGSTFGKILNHPDLPAFLEKVLTMTPEQLQDFFNSDDRVQGFTFILPENMIQAAKEIIDTMDITSQTETQDIFRMAGEAATVFDDAYDEEGTVTLSGNLLKKDGQ